MRNKFTILFINASLGNFNPVSPQISHFLQYTQNGTFLSGTVRAFMHPVRRNTKEFKRVVKILTQYRKNAQAKKSVKLYALKPTQSLNKKILINTLKQNRDVLYEMNFDSIIAYLDDTSRKLYREDNKPFYYFKTSAGSDWHELPFEFSGQAKKDVQKFLKPVMKVVK